jgi:hypothetical protein
MERIDRRVMLAMLGGAAAAPLLPGIAHAAPAGFTMWRDPGCGCCIAWAKRIETAFGRPLAVVQTHDMAAVKRAQGVPAELRSCHTALIGSLVIEGHVPPADIKRLIARRDGAIRGLAVPDMPAGAPGMEVPGGDGDSYKVYAFGSRGAPTVFARYG